MRIYEVTRRINEASLSYEHGSRSWYHPTTKEFINVQTSHMKVVLANPEKFGISPDEIEDAKKQIEAEPVQEGKERIIINLAIQHGWVRIASQDRQNPRKCMMIDGASKPVVHNVLRLFFNDQNGETLNAIVKFSGFEYFLVGNDVVDLFITRRVLPEPHRSTD